MATDGARNPWGVEVVRGREPGRRFALAEGETTIGNAPKGPGHLSLADQEGASPRRMTERQAALIVSGGTLAIRDLDGPAATFVNRQRLLSGVDRPLAPGDEIQLGGVRLVVRRESKPAAPRSTPTPTPTPPPIPPRPSPAAPPRPGPLAAPYAFPGGLVCRSWDDFLALAAQRWPLVRDELAAGRLAEHMRRVGRPDLLPRKSAGWSADDVLDDWLGRLPATRSSAPELDVHPDALVIRAAGGGGTIRRTIRIANVGYRLLRSTVRVESSRARLVGDGALATIDETDVELEIDLPEGGGDQPLGAVVIKSNGGTRRVEIRLERARAEVISIAADDAGAGLPLVDLAGLIPPARRLWLFPLVLAGAQVLIAGDEPRLSTLAVAGSVLGFLVGTGLGARGGDVTASGFAGAAGGLLTSALVFAAVRSVHGLVGPSLATGPLAVALWMLIGVGLALASLVAFPAREGEGA